MQSKLLLVLILGLSALGTSAQDSRPVPSATESAEVPRTIFGGVLNGKAKVLPQPVYPQAAIAAKVGGAVDVKITINEEGRVISAVAVSGDPMLQDAAVTAAKAAVFAPTTLEGKPAMVSGRITYNFIAQPKHEQPLVPEADKDKVWALGAMIAIIKTDNSKFLDVILEGGRFEDMINDLIALLPSQLANERRDLELLSKASPGERGEIASRFLRSVKKQLNPEQTWQVEMGSHFGYLFEEMFEFGEAVEKGKPLGAANINKRLQLLKGHLSGAPKESPAELIRKFTAVANFADSSKLEDPDGIIELMDAIDELMNDAGDVRTTK